MKLIIAAEGLQLQCYSLPEANSNCSTVALFIVHWTITTISNYYIYFLVQMDVQMFDMDIQSLQQGEYYFFPL